MKVKRVVLASLAALGVWGLMVAGSEPSPEERLTEQVALAVANSVSQPDATLDVEASRPRLCEWTVRVPGFVTEGDAQRLGEEMKPAVDSFLIDGKREFRLTTLHLITPNNQVNVSFFTGGPTN